MSWDKEREVIATYFSENWSLTDAPVMWENLPFEQPATAFIAFSILSTYRSQKSFGAEQNIFRNWGVVQIDIYVPENTGTSEAKKLAGKTSELFLNKVLPVDVGENIQFKVPSIAVLGIRNGRFRVTVSCPFYRTEQLRA